MRTDVEDIYKDEYYKLKLFRVPITFIDSEFRMDREYIGRVYPIGTLLYRGELVYEHLALVKEIIVLNDSLLPLFSDWWERLHGNGILCLSMGQYINFMYKDTKLGKLYYENH
jgi:hypothetical protein